MKHILFAFFISLLTAVAQAQDIPPPPNPPRLVNDFADVLNPGQEEALEQKLRRYNDTTSTQFVIVTVNTYGAYDASEYTFALGNRWGIGQQGKNNGLLITVAVQDRKYFVATGYGLEGSIPDAIANRIGDEYFRPNFRANDYYRGLDEATTYLASLPAAEFRAERRNRSNDSGGGFWLLIGLLVLFLVIIPIIRKSRRGGGRGYHGGGGMFFPPFITFGSGGSSGSWGGGGGGSSFEGFGGGSFGGGGAGGDW